MVLTGVAVLAGALTAANQSVRSDILARQAEVATRTQFINESVALGRMNSQLIQALANLSAQGNDEAIRTMLAKHGVTFSVAADATAADAKP